MLNYDNFITNKTKTPPKKKIFFLPNVGINQHPIKNSMLIIETKVPLPQA